MTAQLHPLDTRYTCLETDLQTLTGFFHAALDGHENKAALKRLWEQQLGVVRASHTPAKSAAVLIDLIDWIRETKDMARNNLDHRYGTVGDRHVELILSQVLDKYEELRQHKERER